MVSKCRPPGRRNRIYALFERLLKGLSLFAAVMLFALMVLTFVDVVGRELNAPLRGAYDLTKLSLGVLLFTALPLVTWEEKHLTIDLVTGMIPRRARKPLRLISLMLAAFVLAVFAWRLWAQGNSLQSYGQKAETLGVPIAPLAWFMAVFAAFAAVVSIMLAIAILTGARDADKTAGGAH